MNFFSLAESLELAPKELVSIYGAGGKSTLLLRLAWELAKSGSRVVVTTTTKMFVPASMPLVTAGSLAEALEKLEQAFAVSRCVSLGRKTLPGDKIEGIGAGLADEIFSSGIAPYVLVEADGAARRPIKGYAPYEPVIPSKTTALVPVLGLDAVGREVNEENVHRAELFVEQIGAGMGRPLEVRHFARCLSYTVGIGRAAAPAARVVPIVNKLDLAKNPDLVRNVANLVAEETPVDRLFFTAAREENPVKYVFSLESGKARPSVACVVLAAGSSARMGKDKLSLKIGGKTLLERAVGAALSSPVSEVIVVTRPDKGAAKYLPLSWPVKIITNPSHHEGISSSLKAGLLAASQRTQGIIFALGDQPFVSTKVYELLLNTYYRELKLITVPLYRGKRGNPVLIDRRAWPLLMGIGGDAGGRQILPLVPEEEIATVEVGDPGVLADIDTEEDFKRYRLLW